MKKFGILALMLLASVSFAQTSSYSWEDGNGILGSYGSIDTTASGFTTAEAVDGSGSLLLVENPLSGTPEGYVAWITGVSEGDIITATAWMKGMTGGTDADSKGRLWFKFTGADDINTYGGSATNDNDAYGGEGGIWTEFEQGVTVAAGQTAVALSARIYSYGAHNSLYIDLLTVTAPDGATITFPGNDTPVDTYTVPDVTGMTEAQAVSAVEGVTGANFTAVVSEEYSSTVGVGYVISQNPAGNSNVVADTVVSVVISKGLDPDPNTVKSTVKADVYSNYYLISGTDPNDPSIGAQGGQSYINVAARDALKPSWGAIRISTAGVKAELNNNYGEGNWEIIDINLTLTHSPYNPYDGKINLLWTSDDLTDLSTLMSLSDGSSSQIGGQFALDPVNTNGRLIGTYDYDADIPKNDENKYALYDEDATVNSLQATLFDDFLNDDAMTFAIEDNATSSPAAGWYGSGNTSLYPRLDVRIRSFIVPVTCDAPPAYDTNDDCVIDFADFVAYASQWLYCGLSDCL